MSGCEPSSRLQRRPSGVVQYLGMEPSLDCRQPPSLHSRAGGVMARPVGYCVPPARAGTGAAAVRARPPGG